MAQIRRVQAEIWPLIAETVEDFFSSTAPEGRLSESASVDLTAGVGIFFVHLFFFFLKLQQKRFCSLASSVKQCFGTFKVAT